MNTQTQEATPVVLRLLPPHERQKQFIELFDEMPQVRFLVLACGSKFGKTVGSALLLLREALRHEHSISWWVSPSYSQTDIARALLKSLLPASLFEEAVAARKLYLLTPDGRRFSEIHFKSADDADKLRGHAVNFCVCDEAARMSREAWVSIFTTLSQTQGRCVLISTPSLRNWFREVYEWGVKCLPDGSPKFADGEVDPHPEFYSLRLASSANPFLSPESLATAKRTMSSDEFRQEILAEFLQDGSSVFRNVRGCCEGDSFEPPVEGHSYVIGADLARLKDFTVLIVGDRATRRVVHIARFNQLQWQVQEHRILDLARKYNNATTYIDASGIGDPVIEALRAGGLTLVPYKITGTAAKQQLISGLQLALEQRQIMYPFDRLGVRTAHVATLINELETYEFSITPSGVVSYASPGHDDTVIALALLVFGLDQGEWQYRWGTMDSTGKVSYGNN